MLAKFLPISKSRIHVNYFIKALISLNIEVRILRRVDCVCNVIVSGTPKKIEKVILTYFATQNPRPSGRQKAADPRGARRMVAKPAGRKASGGHAFDLLGKSGNLA